MAGDSRGVEEGHIVTPKRRVGQDQSVLNPSRRRFLTLAAKGAVAGLAIKQGWDLKQGTERVIGNATAKVGRVFKGGESNLNDTSVQKLGEGLVGSEVPARPITEFDLAYPHLADADRASAWETVRKAQTVMIDNIGFEQMKQIAQYEDFIRQSAKDAQMPENLLLGLVITESQGNPLAVSDAGAKGLTQIMDETARSLGIKIYEGEGNERDDERYIPEIVLPKSAKALREEYDRFGDWGLALWSWHAGDPAIYRAIRMYCWENFSVDLPDIRVEEADQSEEAKAAVIEEVGKRRNLYKTTIAERGINLYKLFQDENVVQMFSGPQWDKTEEYVPRIVASSVIYNSNKNLALV